MENENKELTNENKPKWLSDAECLNPQFVIGEFFETYTLDQLDNKLWSLLVTALSADNGDYQTGLERAGLLYMHEHLMRLVEASYFAKNPR